MLPELKPGREALLHNARVRVLELTGHATTLVQLESGAVREVERAALIPIATTEETLGKTQLADIPVEHWENAQRRAEAIRRIEAKASGKTEAIAAEALALGLSPRQLMRSIKEFRRHGTISQLMPHKVGRKLGARVLDLAVERIIRDAIEAFYLQPERPSVIDLTNRVQALCRQASLSPPTRQTVSKRVEAYRDRASTAKRLGGKAAKYACVPMAGHVQVDAPLERVEIDHTPLDVMIQSDDPLCPYVGRPWLTIAIDVYTRCVLGIHIGFEPPSILSVALCMTHAVLPKNPAQQFGVPIDWPMQGKPREIVVDNGKDFVSMAFRRGCHEHGIILTTRPVGSPHYGGTIERLIGTMVGRCHMLPGTTKRNSVEKGDYDAKKHAALTLSELRRWFVEQIGHYHAIEHRILRKPPQVAWQRAMATQQEVADAV